MISSNKKLKYIIKDNEEFIEKYSYKISVRQLGLMVSGFIASLLIASIGYQGLVLLQILLCFILVYFSFKLKEETIDSELSSSFKLRSLQSVINTIKDLPFHEMAKVIVVSVPFFVSIDVLLQPLLIEAKVPLWSFPLFIAGSNLLIFVAINKSHALSIFFNVNPFLNSLIPLSGLIAYVLTSSPYWGLAGMILTIFSRCFSVVESALFINKIPSKKQSTIESILNTLNIIGVSILSFIYSWLVKNYNLWYASLIFLIIIFVFIIIFQIAIIKKGPAVKPAPE
jgi:MFS family permease